MYWDASKAAKRTETKTHTKLQVQRSSASNADVVHVSGGGGEKAGVAPSQWATMRVSRPWARLRR